jgi:hypothetical protein
MAVYLLTAQSVKYGTVPTENIAKIVQEEKP